MSFTITLKNEDKLLDLLDLLERAPVRAVKAVVAGVDAGSQLLLAQAIKERFTGRGPFPVADNKLGVKSGQLRRSLRFTRAEVGANGVVTTRAGSNLKYFGVHEFGLNGKVSVRAARVRAHTIDNAFGKGNPFSILSHTRSAHMRNANVPKRAPLTTAIEDHSSRIYVKQIRNALIKLINEFG